MPTNSQQNHSQVATLPLSSVKHPKHYTTPIDSISATNVTLRDLLNQGHIGTRSVFVYIDSGVSQTNPTLCNQIIRYFEQHSQSLQLLNEPQIINGGEAAKQPHIIDGIYQQLLTHKVDRHNCVLVIGGGALERRMVK
jgi:3-dehydroquinate synthase